MFSKRPGLPPLGNSYHDPPPQRRSGGEIRTKIVGTTFKKDGQPLLAQFSDEGQPAFAGRTKKFDIFLRDEPKNPVDGDAIGVWARNINTSREVQLGYIGNNERKCPRCGKEYDKVKRSTEAVTTCLDCGSATVRDGLATRLQNSARKAGRLIDDMFEIRIDWDNGGITGGGRTARGETKNFGCNILITER